MTPHMRTCTHTHTGLLVFDMESCYFTNMSGTYTEEETSTHPQSLSLICSDLEQDWNVLYLTCMRILCAGDVHTGMGYPLRGVNSLAFRWGTRSVLVMFVELSLN